MATTYTAGKAKRKDFALFFVDETVPASPVNELIGKGIEDTSISPSATVDTVNDVTGTTETTLSAYEKTMDLDPIYVTGGNKFSETLDKIEETGAILDDVIYPFIFVKMYKTTAADTYVAWKQDAVVEITGFGGDTKGVNAPCTLHFIGDRAMGTFNPTTKTFTADA